MPTPQSRIKAFVEEELQKYTVNRGILPSTKEEIIAALHRAIQFGLKLGREAGPGRQMPDADFIHPTDIDRCECARWNFALDAKNQAIDDLIKSVG